MREGRTAADFKLRVCGSEKDRKTERKKERKWQGEKSTTAYSNTGNGTDSEKDDHGDES